MESSIEMVKTTLRNNHGKGAINQLPDRANEWRLAPRKASGFKSPVNSEQQFVNPAAHSFDRFNILAPLNVHMYKAIIIEDEKNAAAALELLIAEHCPEVKVVECCTSVPEGVLAIHKHQPAIIFLDIEMPVYSGFELFRFIPDPQFSVIFITAYSQYAIRAFDVSAVDYVLKPVESEALMAAVRKAVIQQDKEMLIKKIQTLRENTSSDKIRKIALPISDGLAFVETETIEYVEAEGTYTRIFLKDRSQLLISKNIKMFEDILCRQENFIRIHRSHIVNTDYILQYNRGEGYLLMHSGANLRISREKKQWFEDFIRDYRVGGNG